MQAEQNPDYLRAVQRTVLDFKDALTEFLKLYVVNDSLVGRGMMPAVLPREGADPDEMAAGSRPSRRLPDVPLRRRG